MKQMFNALVKSISFKKALLWGGLTAALAGLEALSILSILDLIKTCAKYVDLRDSSSLHSLKLSVAKVACVFLARFLAQYVFGRLQTDIYLTQLKFTKEQVASSFHTKLNLERTITGGDLIFYSNEGPEITSQVFTSTLWAITHFTVGIALVYLLCRESILFAGILLTSIFATYLIHRILSKRLYASSVKVADAESNFNQALYEDIAGRIDIVGMNLESLRRQTRKFLVNVFAEAVTQRDKSRFLISSLSEFFGALIVVVTILLFTFYNFKNGDFMTHIMALIIVAQRLSGRMSGLTSALSQMNEGWPVVKRISEIISNNYSPTDLKDIAALLPLKISNFSFCYPDSSFNLGPISIQINSGDWIGVSGPNGSGKTSLAHILTGNLVTQSLSTPCHIYVGPDPIIFSGELINNILCGRPMDLENFRRIINFCGLTNLFAEKSKQPINNDQFSKGERQRVGIARALYSNPPLLVLDESLSSIDSESAMTILTAIESQFPQMAVVLISHNVEILSRAREFWALENGRLSKTSESPQKSKPSPPDTTV